MLELRVKFFLLVGFVLEGDVLKDVVNKGLLLDYYRPLLTEKQRYCMEQHYEHDLSLGEIAEELNISCGLIAVLICTNSSIMTSSIAKRPAVSMITTSFS